MTNVVAARQRQREPLLAVADDIDGEPSASNARARKARIRASSSTTSIRIVSLTLARGAKHIRFWMTCK